jgi:hypothetical protein
MGSEKSAAPFNWMPRRSTSPVEAGSVTPPKGTT